MTLNKDGSSAADACAMMVAESADAENIDHTSGRLRDGIGIFTLFY